MKRFNLLLLMAATVLATSCGETEADEPQVEEQETVEMAEPVSYTLNKEQTQLTWKGSEGEHEFHVGTIAFSEGSVTMKGDELVEGSFAVDMKTITVTDEGMPDGKKNMLKGHLENDDFFNVPEFPATNVKLIAYSGNELEITLEVLGQEINAKVPVKMTQNDDQLSITGEFSIDFSSLGMPGLEPEEDEDESISPNLEFTLNAVLNK